jgi:hypothetical protein
MMGAVALHVAMEYGHTGYRVGLAACTAFGDVGVFEARHFDGSTFNLVADRWGNVKRPEDESADGVRDLVERMGREAVAA